MNIKALVPWWAKIAVKVALSKVGVDQSWWQKCGLFVHGAMHEPTYAFRVVRSHMDRVGWATLEGKVVLELGPGDSLATAVIAAAFGAERTYLSDTGAYAHADINSYRTLQTFLESAGLRPPNLGDCQTVDQVLAKCHAAYLTDGSAGLRRISSASVDLVFSQAVLEHVSLHQFAETQREIRRLLRPSGIASHQVDLKDHLGGALNNLRFADKTWEADWMVASGFYTNRLRLSEVLAMVGEADLAPEITDVQRWEVLPTPRLSMNPRFRAMSDDELLVQQFDFIARPRSVGPA